MNLTLSKVSKTYAKNKHANKNVDLVCKPGIFGLLGPNGAGKTTLMKIIATVQKPSKGTVRLNDVDIVNNPEVMREKLGYLPQMFGTYDHLTGREFLAYVAALKGLSGKIMKQRIDSVLAELNLSEVAGKKILTYSGGMKQRIGIAQAILNDPKILIFDEPTVGLDPEERVRFRNLISELAQDSIVLLSTHIVSDVDSVADQVLIMKQGEIIRQGTQKAIVEQTVRYIYEVEQTPELSSTIPEHRIINTMRKQNKMVVRYWQEEPDANLSAHTPTLEDTYLVLSKSKV